MDLKPITPGIMPLLAFASAVRAIFGRNLIFCKTALGRTFGATSDDPVTASLVGINPRTVFAMAMVIVTLAALCLGIRSNLDPSVGGTCYAGLLACVGLGGAQDGRDPYPAAVAQRFGPRGAA